MTPRSTFETYFVLGMAPLLSRSSLADDTRRVEIKSLGVPLMGKAAHLQSDVQLDQRVFIIEGRRYRKFESGSGAIYVLDHKQLSEHDFETAQCASNVGPATEISDEPAVVGVEKSLGSDQDWKVYTAVIQQTIQSRCDGRSIPPVRVNPQLELGISHTVNQSHGANTEYRIFNRNLGLNVNLGINF